MSTTFILLPAHARVLRLECGAHPAWGQGGYWPEVLTPCHRPKRKEEGLLSLGLMQPPIAHTPRSSSPAWVRSESQPHRDTPRPPVATRLPRGTPLQPSCQHPSTRESCFRRRFRGFPERLLQSPGRARALRPAPCRCGHRTCTPRRNQPRAGRVRGPAVRAACESAFLCTKGTHLHTM